MRIKNKTILVTGGTGFIGSNTAQALSAKGARVISIDRTTTQKQTVTENIQLHKCDLQNPCLEAVFKKEKPEYVYHFASSAMTYKEFDPMTDAQSVFASVNVMRYALEYGVKKFVLASSGIVYGNNAPQPTPETQPVSPENPYAISKYVVESYMRFYGQAFHMPYVIFRYPNVYGPGQKIGALSYFIRTLVSDEQAEIRGDGSLTRDYIFIDDVVQANLRALVVPDDFPDPTFNIGTGKETSLNTLYDTITQLLRRESRPVYTPARIGEQLRYCLNASKFQKITGWDVQTTLKEGLKKTIAFHQNT